MHKVKYSLRRCPFCGSESTLWVHMSAKPINIAEGITYTAVAQCNNKKCEAMIQRAGDDLYEVCDNVAKAWNNRRQHDTVIYVEPPKLLPYYADYLNY